MNRTPAISLALVVSSLLALSACERGGEGVFGSGFVEATTVLVSAEIGGLLDALYVDEGSSVTRGDLLGVIDTVTVVLETRRASAQLDAARMATNVAAIDIERARQDEALARKEFDRIAGLREKGSGTQQQYDRAESHLRQAELGRRLAESTLGVRRADVARIQSEIDLLADRLDKCRPTAPVTGVVTNKLIEAGELLSPGRPIVEVARMDSMWVKVYVPAHALTDIRIGGPASVDTEGGSDPLEGRIVWVADEAEFTPKNVQTAEARADLVYAVKVNIANPGGALKIGMPVMVRLK